MNPLISKGLISDDSFVQYTKPPSVHRIQESGVLMRTRPLVWGFSCKGYPLWLLVLNPLNCGELHIRGFITYDCFISNLDKTTRPLVGQIFSKLGFSWVKFVGSRGSKVEIELCSGSLPYLFHHISLMTGKGIFLLDTPWGRRSPPRRHPKLRWRIYKPEHFGSGVNIFPGYWQ